MNGLEVQDNTALWVFSLYFLICGGVLVAVMWRYYEPFLRWLSKHFHLGRPGRTDETIDTLVWKGRIGLVIGLVIGLIGFIGVFFLDW